jgi:hypothetical protein
VRFKLRGLISRGSGYERFKIDLDRSGNEEAILKNAEAAELGIRAATPVGLSDYPWTATFMYPLDNHDAANVGIDAVRLAAPFLFGTCEHLGQLSVRRLDGMVESWIPQEPTELVQGEIVVRERIFTHDCGDVSTTYRVLRLIPDDPYDTGLFPMGSSLASRFISS